MPVSSRLLIVDDDDALRRSLANILESRGYQVEEAASGEEAVDMVMSKPFDLALVDIRLPDSEGVDLIPTLLGIRHDMVLIMVTAFATVENAVEALNLGATAYLTKPLNIEELFSVVSDQLDKRRLTRENQRLLQINAAVSEASLHFLDTRSLHSTAELIVEKATELTGAEVGLLARVEDEQISILAASRVACASMEDGASHAKADPSRDENQGFAIEAGHTLLHAPLREGHAIIVNEFDAEAMAVMRAPEGHMALDCYLGVPVVSGDETIGLLAVANRAGGFGEEEAGVLENLAASTALVLQAARVEREREKAEEQLRAAQRLEAVGRVTGGIAHDFNNCLAVVLCYSEMLLEGFHAADPARDDVMTIRDSASAAAQLTGKLLAFSRQQVQRLEHIDLNRILRELEKMLGRVLGDHVELAVRTTGELGLVEADGAQLEQVIMNLAINARDAMPDGGNLTMETHIVQLDDTYSSSKLPHVPPGPYVLLSVADTGIGMDEETKEHIFEPFYTTKEVGEGTGLGLSTVFGTVKQSGGFIWVYSEPGMGTTFKLYLPYVEAGEESRSTITIETPPPGHETILLVEDDPMIRKIVKRVLRKHGYRVLDASNGGEALLLAEQCSDPIPLMITDVVMPKMNGRELAERLREQRPELRVLFMSGHASDAVIHQGIIDADTDFLGKPFMPIDLLNEIRRILDR